MSESSKTPVESSPGLARAVDEVCNRFERAWTAGQGARVSFVDIAEEESRMLVAEIQKETGTAPHFIRVDDSQRRGMGINRINKSVKEGSLVINGKFVGATVHHPGARPHPFLRPALDMKEGEAIAAAQAYIDARITPSGITGDSSGDEDQ